MQKLLFILILVFSSTVNAAERFFFKPNLGLDIGNRRITFQEEFGKEHFPTNFRQTTPYLEVRFHKNWGIQLEHGFTSQETEVKTYAAGETVLGEVNLDALNNTAFVSKASFRENYVGFNAYYPIHEIEFFAGFGIANARLHLRTQQASRDGSNLTSLEDVGRMKNIMRINVGIKAQNTRHLGFKFNVIWQDITKLKSKTTFNPEGYNAVFNIKPRRTVAVLLGLFYAV